MKYLASLVLALAVAQATPTKPARVPGINLSADQGSDINWGAVAANGVKFVYVQATEGTNHQSPLFDDLYYGAANASLFHGAYHIALPGASSPGDKQASYFYKNGGKWSRNGYTLPGAVVLIANPNGDMCYGLSPDDMRKWIRAFVSTYQGYTNRYPVICTFANWWNACTNSDPYFGDNGVPLATLYDYSIAYGLPDGWSHATFSQYTYDAYPNPGSGDYFNGSEGDLQKFVNGS